MEETAIPVPKRGTYNLDFLDDNAGANPFASKCKMAESPPANSGFDENINPFQSKSKIGMSPPRNPADDNFNPFVTKSKMRQSPVPFNNQNYEEHNGNEAEDDNLSFGQKRYIENGEFNDDLSDPMFDSGNEKADISDKPISIASPDTDQSSSALTRSDTDQSSSALTRSDREQSYDSLEGNVLQDELADDFGTSCNRDSVNEHISKPYQDKVAYNDFRDAESPEDHISGSDAFGSMLGEKGTQLNKKKIQKVKPLVSQKPFDEWDSLEVRDNIQGMVEEPLKHMNNNSEYPEFDPEEAFPYSDVAGNQIENEPLYGQTPEAHPLQVPNLATESPDEHGNLPAGFDHGIPEENSEPTEEEIFGKGRNEFSLLDALNNDKRKTEQGLGLSKSMLLSSPIFCEDSGLGDSIVTSGSDDLDKADDMKSEEGMESLPATPDALSDHNLTLSQKHDAGFEDDEDVQPDEIMPEMYEAHSEDNGEEPFSGNKSGNACTALEYGESDTAHDLDLIYGIGNKSVSPFEEFEAGYLKGLPCGEFEESGERWDGLFSGEQQDLEKSININFQSAFGENAVSERDLEEILAENVFGNIQKQKFLMSSCNPVEKIYSPESLMPSRKLQEQVYCPESLMPPCRPEKHVYCPESLLPSSKLEEQVYSLESLMPSSKLEEQVYSLESLMPSSKLEEQVYCPESLMPSCRPEEKIYCPEEILAENEFGNIQKQKFLMSSCNPEAQIYCPESPLPSSKLEEQVYCPDSLIPPSKLEEQIYCPESLLPSSKLEEPVYCPESLLPTSKLEEHVYCPESLLPSSKLEEHVYCPESLMPSHNSLLPSYNSVEQLDSEGEIAELTGLDPALDISNNKESDIAKQLRELKDILNSIKNSVDLDEYNLTPEEENLLGLPVEKVSGDTIDENVEDFDPSMTTTKVNDKSDFDKTGPILGLNTADDLESKSLEDSKHMLTAIGYGYGDEHPHDGSESCSELNEEHLTGLSSGKHPTYKSEEFSHTNQMAGSGYEINTTNYAGEPLGDGLKLGGFNADKPMDTSQESLSGKMIPNISKIFNPDTEAGDPTMSAIVSDIAHSIGNKIGLKVSGSPKESISLKDLSPSKSDDSMDKILSKDGNSPPVGVTSVEGSQMSVFGALVCGSQLIASAMVGPSAVCPPALRSPYFNHPMQPEVGSPNQNQLKGKPATPQTSPPAAAGKVPLGNEKISVDTERSKNGPVLDPSTTKLAESGPQPTPEALGSGLQSKEPSAVENDVTSSQSKDCASAPPPPMRVTPISAEVNMLEDG